jgi:RNA polymerase sigma-70 factor, ECF subfamily
MIMERPRFGVIAGGGAGSWNHFAVQTEYGLSASNQANVSPVQAAHRVPDDELVRRAAAGDGDAFASLYRRRRPDVFRFTLHMTADSSVAEDVVQDVFLAVMRDAGRFEPGRATVAAWLCGIARNQLRQRLARDRRLAPLANDEEPPESAVVQPDALAGLIRGERLGALRRAVLSLPLRYREAVVLCDLQELSYADAASALACAVGTVRSRLHRGRALLASKMAAGEVAGSRAVAAGCGEPERGLDQAGARRVGRATLEPEGWVS